MATKLFCDWCSQQIQSERYCNKVVLHLADTKNVQQWDICNDCKAALAKFRMERSKPEPVSV